MKDPLQATMNANQYWYWEECISAAAEDCGLKLTAEQLDCIAGAVESGHENYGMAFYSPPSSDRISEIEREWKAKLEKAENEAKIYRENAEKAVKQALHQRSDARISIGEYGEVFRHGGRTVQIQ